MLKVIKNRYLKISCKVWPCNKSMESLQKFEKPAPEKHTMTTYVFGFTLNKTQINLKN